MSGAVCGALAVLKPPGPTSQQVVAAVRRLAGPGAKAGHAGTLDPAAAGVLPLLLGAATRLADYLHLPPKEYRFELVLGATTDTQDSTGVVTGETDAGHVDADAVDAALAAFVGHVSQRPPAYSARHHAGRRLYEYARQGRTVEPEAVTVRIDELRRLTWTPGRRARALCALVCGSGTYVRALCADVGARVGTGGHMGALVRHRSGGFSGADCQTLEELTEAARDPGWLRLVRSPSEAVAFLPVLVVDGAEARAVETGRAPGRRRAAPGDAPGPVRVLDAAGRLLAVASRQVERGIAAFALERVMPPEALSG